MNDREKIEKAADRIRDELMLTLQEIDRRREKALDVKTLVRQGVADHSEQIKAAGGVLLVLAAAGVSYSIWRARTRPARLRAMRWEGVKRAWSHPERLARNAPARPLGQELGKKLVLIFASSLATALARRSMSTLVPVGSQQAQSAQ